MSVDRDKSPLNFLEHEEDKRGGVPRRDRDYLPMTLAQVEDMLHDVMETKNTSVMMAAQIKSICNRVSSLQTRVNGDHDLLMIRTGPISKIDDQQKQINIIIQNQAILKAYAKAGIWLIGSFSTIMLGIQVYVKLVS